MTIEAYREQFAAMEGRLPGAELPWLAALRQDALARFCDTGFPGPKVEAWRNTNLNPLRKDAFAPATAAPATDERPPSLLPEGRTHRLDFVNGLLAGGADELPEGVTLLGLAEATAAAADLLDGRLGALSADDDLPLPALNQALTRDGYVLRLARGVVLERPIEIVFSATEPAAASYPRNLIVAESGEHDARSVRRLFARFHVADVDQRELDPEEMPG